MPLAIAFADEVSRHTKQKRRPNSSRSRALSRNEATSECTWIANPLAKTLRFAAVAPFSVHDL